MACLLAPTAAAIIITAAKKKIPVSWHINWLLALLWGGVLWLIPEHIYHGEVVAYPPFFTAGFTHIAAEVLRVGVPMVIAVTLIWAVFAAISNYSKRLFVLPRPAFFMVLGAVIMFLIDRI